MLGARVCNFPVGGNQYYEGLSIGRASELLNVSPETISRAKKVLARGIPELVKAVDDGLLKVGKAYTIAKKQPQQQREELDRLLAAASPVGRTSAVEKHNPPKWVPTTPRRRFRAKLLSPTPMVRWPPNCPKPVRRVEIKRKWHPPGRRRQARRAARRRQAPRAHRGCLSIGVMSGFGPATSRPRGSPPSWAVSLHR